MTQTRHYFGTDGIRGRVGADIINPEFILKLGWAAGQVLGGGQGNVLIGKDTRISGYMLESALEAGLTAAGVGIRLLGPMPTPGIAYLTHALQANAGIVISASHNPHHDNGIKFFSASGDKLPDAVEQKIEAMLAQPLTCVSPEKLGKAQRIEDADRRYIEFCQSTIPSDMHFNGMKIVIDCAHGATYHIAPSLLTETGADVITIGDAPNGTNINDQVGATHTDTICQAVLQHGADLGIALDGDGDRLMMVDATGQVYDGDDILYILAKSHQRQQTLTGQVVGTIMTNFGLETALNQAGIGLVRTQVGDRYILEKLRAEHWALGGEPSGHIICRNHTTTGDGIISALQILAEIRRTGKDLMELSQGLEKFPQVLINVRLNGAKAADIMQSNPVKNAVHEVERQLGCHGRTLLRPSGTEPLIRVMVEGRDTGQVQTYAELIADAVRSAR
jgi:phosphoglucosamine mutase